MSAARTRTPFLDRLAELDVELRQAQGRLSELEAHRTSSIRDLDAAKAPLDAYYEAVGAGERSADPEVEAGLLETVRHAGAHVRLEAGPDLRSGAMTLVAVDERAERMVAGAQRAVVAAQQTVAAFLQVERAGLAGELAGMAAAARDAQQAAVPALAQAVDADRRVRAKWRRLLRANGQPDTLEPSPLRGWDDLITGGGRIPLAVPAGLVDTAAA